MNNNRLGFDIEFLVQDERGTPIPAGFLPIAGVKGHPEKLQFGGLEIDCCAAEITPPPAVSEDEFSSNIDNLISEVRARFPDKRFIAKPSQYFDMQLLMIAPHAMTMGCDPDFNAWTGRRNPRPKPPKGLRSFGGHIHIEGGTVETIKAMDMVLGLWSVVNDPDTERRKIYGKAGAFRHKPYGVEYRVLSSFWCDSDGLRRTVYRRTRMAQDLTTDQINHLVNLLGGATVVQGVINTSNIKDALGMTEVVENFINKKAA